MRRVASGTSEKKQNRKRSPDVAESSRIRQRSCSLAGPVSISGWDPWNATFSTRVRVHRRIPDNDGQYEGEGDDKKYKNVRESRYPIMNHAREPLRERVAHACGTLVRKKGKKKKKSAGDFRTPILLRAERARAISVSAYTRKTYLLMLL